MPRAALIAAAALALAASASATPGAGMRVDPHVDPAVLPVGCPTCHRGHGVSRSPMLAAPQRETCLACHGTRGDLERQVRAGRVSPDARPALLAAVLALAAPHPLTPRAFSEHEPRAVTCSSCHSPHRGTREAGERRFPAGRRLLSSKDPQTFEYQLCESCHGGAGAPTAGRPGVAQLFDPGNRSYHPVEAPARDGAPSVIPELLGREINCTECHASDNPSGPRGPHGSSQPFLLRARYVAVDGGGPTASAHALCYLCHRRESLTDARALAWHARHVSQVGAACATCHNPHGSTRNRALVRFGEEAFVAGVSPSLKTGRLEFVSEGPGSGACYLTCHGRDHAPEAYGVADDLRRPALEPPSPQGR